MSTFKSFRLSPMVFLVLILCFICAPAFAGYKAVYTPKPDDPIRAWIYELDNGLRVYISENHDTPRFYAQVAVRAGGIHVPPETTGLAHYLEHLLFKGNQEFGTLDYQKEKPHLDRIEALYEEHFKEKDPKKRAAIYEEINKESQLAAQYAVPNDITNVYTALGAANLNAYTSEEETVYLVDLPSHRLRQWAIIEADRYINPVFRIFHTELETVYEEKNTSLDSRDNLLREAVDKALFKKHPYGQLTVIGEAEHLKNPSIKNIRNFFTTFYVPNNMAVVLAGDLNPEETIRIVNEQFGRWARKDLPPRKTWTESPMKEREQVTVNYEGEEALILAFLLPGEKDPEADALDLAGMVLSNRAAGLIDLNINQQQKMRRAGARVSLMGDYGELTLQGTLHEDQSLEEAEKLLLGQVQLLIDGKFDEGLLKACINNQKKRLKSAQESNRGLAGMMTRSFTAHEDWPWTLQRIQRMEKVTKEDVVRVAKKYFSQPHVAGYRRDAPHKVVAIEKPKIDKITIDPSRRSKFMDQVLAMSVKEPEPVFVQAGKDYEVRRDPKGADIYYVRNSLNDLFTLSLHVDLGTRQNNKLGLATRLLDLAGTTRLSPEELKKEWFKLATSFDVRAGDDETAITISGLDENLEASLALALDLLKNPKIEAESFNEMIRTTLERRKDDRTDPRAIFPALTQYAFFADKSSFLTELPGAEVRKLTPDELFGVARGLLNYRRAIAYTGSMPLDKLAAILQKHLPTPEALQAPPRYEPLQLRQADKTTVYLFNKVVTQSRVQMQFADGLYSETDRPAAEIFSAYFGGGMSGLVFQELREARGLAYLASSRYGFGERARDQNRVDASINCQPDKTATALDVFGTLFDSMPVSQERYSKTIQSLLSRYRASKLGFREVIGAVRGWERLGLAGDPRAGRYEKLQKADIATMLDFYQRHIQSRPTIISIFGDQSRMDTAKLAKRGEIVQVNLDQIFVK